MIATMALVIILSAFNGLEKIIVSQFNSFNPELKVSVNQGKYLHINDSIVQELNQISNIERYSFTFEELAVIKYGEQMHPFTVKGVDEHFSQISGIDTMLLDGEYQLQNGQNNFAVVGYQIAEKLSIGIHFTNPIIIYAPKRMSKSVLNPASAFNKKYLFPSAIFAIDESADDKLLIPLSFCQDLYQAKNLATNIEIKLKDKALVKQTKQELQSALGTKYKIQTQREQNNFQKVINAERFMIYMILSFVLLIAGFNIIAMITMLIVDKKRDFLTFQSLGLTTRQIKYVFLFTGWMSSISGAVLGLILGGFVAWLQVRFSLIGFGNGQYDITAYPVDIVALDFVYVFFLVIGIGLVTSLIPVRKFEKNYLD